MLDLTTAGGDFIVRALATLSQHLDKEFTARCAAVKSALRAEAGGRRASNTAAVCGHGNRELAKDRDLATATASAPVQAPGARLEPLEHVLHQVVRRCKGNGLTSARVNVAIRNLKDTKYLGNGKKTTAEVVDLVLKHLIDGGLAEDVVTGRARPGRRVRTCRWKQWAAIRGNPASDAIRERLGLVESDFT